MQNRAGRAEDVRVLPIVVAKSSSGGFSFTTTRLASRKGPGFPKKTGPELARRLQGSQKTGNWPKPKTFGDAWPSYLTRSQWRMCNLLLRGRGQKNQTRFLGAFSLWGAGAKKLASVLWGSPKKLEGSPPADVPSRRVPRDGRGDRDPHMCTDELLQPKGRVAARQRRDGRRPVVGARTRASIARCRPAKRPMLAGCCHSCATSLGLRSAIAA